MFYIVSQQCEASLSLLFVKVLKRLVRVVVMVIQGRRVEESVHQTGAAIQRGSVDVVEGNTTTSGTTGHGQKVSLPMVNSAP